MSLLSTPRKSGPWPTIILVIVTAALTIVVMLALKQCQKPTPTGQAPEEILYHINKLGDSVASLRGAEQDFAVQSKRLTDSIANVYGAKLRDLKEYMIAILQTKAEIPVVIGSTQYDYAPPVVINQDTCPAQIRNIRGTFESPYYYVDAQLGEDPHMKLIAFDTLTTVWKDTTIGKLFNKKRYLQLDINLANPDTRVTGLKSYRRPAPAPKKWSFGFQAGYGMVINPRTQRLTPGPYIGIGFTKSLIRF